MITRKSGSKTENQAQSSSNIPDSEQVTAKERTPQISREKMEMLVRNAALTGEIDPEVAMTIAKLIYTTAALADGQAIAKITLKFHDSDIDQGRLRMHGKYGFCLACIKIDTQFGHCCMTIAPGSSRCCVLPSTNIFTAPGVTTKASNLRTGDIIFGYDPVRSVFRETKVTSLIRDHAREAHFRINSELGITGDHPIFARRNNSPWVWTPVEQIEIGDKIYSTKGELTVKSIEKSQGLIDTIYIETETEGFLVELEDSGIVVSGQYIERSTKENLKFLELNEQLHMTE